FLVGARMHEPGRKEKRRGLASAARLTLSLAYYRDLPGLLPAQSVGPQRSGEGDGRFCVSAAAQIAIRENAVRGDPFARLGEDLFGVGLEHQPLARAPAPRIHLGVEALGELVLVIMRVLLRPQVDVALRAAQRL